MELLTNIVTTIIMMANENFKEFSTHQAQVKRVIITFYIVSIRSENVR